MTYEEHLENLLRIYDLMSAKEGTPEGEELDKLVDAVMAYEDEMEKMYDN
jgi:hypothetical protein